MKRLRSCALAIGLILVGCGSQTGSSDPDLFFPTRPDENGAVMDALFHGTLVVRDGCVLIGSAGDYSVPIWWDGFTAERDESGRLVVRNGEAAVIAIEGRSLEIGGGYIAEFQPEDRVEPRQEQLRRVEELLGHAIPERCLGPDVYGVWSVGDSEPL